MKNACKVLHIITRLDMGGSAQNTLDTCLGLDQRKYAVSLVHGLSRESAMTRKERSRVADKIRKARAKGVKVFAISPLVRRIDPIRDIAAFFILIRVIHRQRPTIVHTHTSKAGLIGRLAARMTGVPCIVHTAHGHVFYGHFGPLVSKIFIILEKLADRLTDRMIALTATERNDYFRNAVTVPEKTTTIHSGVDLRPYSQAGTDREAKREILGLKPEDKVVGTIGWLLPIKGPMVLLKAFHRLTQGNGHPLKLVFVGKGEMESKLKREASQLGMAEMVRFLGWREDVPEILPVFDIFVLASMNEGMGRVLVEAMAAEKPIVASAVGGIPDLVKNEENGLLVPPDDDAALAWALDGLIKNPEKARRMGRKGRLLSHEYSLEAMIDKIDALYREMLDSVNQSRRDN